MYDGLKNCIEAIVLVLIVALSVFVTHSIDSATLAKVKAQYAGQESERNAKVLADYAQAVLQRDGLQKKINADTLAAQNDIKGKNDEIDILNRRLAAGTSSVRIKADCPAVRIGTDSKLPQAASPDTSGYARLTRDSEQTYIALRRAIAFQAGQIQACKAYAQAMSK